MTAQIYCNSTAVVPLTGFAGATTGLTTPVSLLVYFRPSATSVTCQLYTSLGGGTSAYMPANAPTGSGTMMLIEEIMGALPEGANDNGTAELRMAG